MHQKVCGYYARTTKQMLCTSWMWMQMKTDLNICMQWVDTIVKPSEASLMSQDFYESRESTMQTTESCSSWPRDHISDIKSQSDQDGQWNTQANRCCGKSTLNSVFGLDMSEKWGGVGTRFSNFKAQHTVIPGQTGSAVHFALLIVLMETFLILLISCLVLLPTSAVNWLVK